VEKIEKERIQVMKTRFNKFVDIVKNGEKAMSIEAFIQSITNEKETKLEDLPQELKVMFVMADLNGDGLISFSEYSFFLTLLSSSNERFRLAFEMMDKDGSGKIDLTEFMQIMNTEGVDSQFVRNMKSLPLMHQFFGKDCSGSLTFSDFSHFVFVFFFLIHIC
jgi:Ca2+-binding EF-hand superfamily protein